MPETVEIRVIERFGRPDFRNISCAALARGRLQVRTIYVLSIVLMAAGKSLSRDQSSQQ